MGWEEGLFEVAIGEAEVGDSGIADWLNELEEEGLEIKNMLLTHLGSIRYSFQPGKELVFVLVKVLEKNNKGRV